MRKLLIALCAAAMLSGCVSAIPEDNPATMIPFVKVQSAGCHSCHVAPPAVKIRPACPCKYAPPSAPNDTPGGIASKAGGSVICPGYINGKEHCQSYRPIQFWPPNHK